MGLLIIGGSGMGEVTPSAGAKMGRVGLFRVDDTTVVLMGIDNGFTGNLVARVVKVLPDNTLVMGDATTLKAGSISLDTSMTGGMLSSTRAAAWWCESGSTIYGIPFTVSGLSITNVGSEVGGFSDENPTFQTDPSSGYGFLTYVSASGLNVSQYRIYNLDGSEELNSVETSIFDSGGGTTDFVINHSYEHPGAGATLITYLESVSGGTKWWRGSYCEFDTGTLANRQDLQLVTGAAAGLADFAMTQKSAPLTSTLALQTYKSSGSGSSVARITNYPTSPVISGTASLPFGSNARHHTVPLDATTAVCIAGNSSSGPIQIRTIDASAATPVVSAQIGASISQDGSFNDEVHMVKVSDGNVMIAYPATSSSTVCRMITAAGAKT